MLHSKSVITRYLGIKLGRSHPFPLFDLQQPRIRELKRPMLLLGSRKIQPRLYGEKKYLVIVPQPDSDQLLFYPNKSVVADRPVIRKAFSNKPPYDSRPQVEPNDYLAKLPRFELQLLRSLGRKRARLHLPLSELQPKPEIMYFFLTIQPRSQVVELRGEHLEPVWLLNVQLA